MTSKSRPQRPSSRGQAVRTPGSIKITKADAALGQLETAIDLYFGDGNPVAVHTLGAAAEEIFSKLCAHAGKPVIDLLAFVPPDMRAETENALRGNRRFFKHAGKDVTAETYFNPKENEFLLLLACDMARSCLGRVTKKLLAFRLWFLLRHPRVIVDTQSAYEMIAKIRAAAVSLDDVDRYDFYERVMAMPFSLQQNAANEPPTPPS